MTLRDARFVAQTDDDEWWRKATPDFPPRRGEITRLHSGGIWGNAGPCSTSTSPCHDTFEGHVIRSRGFVTFAHCGCILAHAFRMKMADGYPRPQPGETGPSNVQLAWHACIVLARFTNACAQGLF